MSFIHVIWTITIKISTGIFFMSEMKYDYLLKYFKRVQSIINGWKTVSIKPVGSDFTNWCHTPYENNAC